MEAVNPLTFRCPHEAALQPVSHLFGTTAGKHCALAPLLPGRLELHCGFWLAADQDEKVDGVNVVNAKGRMFYLDQTPLQLQPPPLVALKTNFGGLFFFFFSPPPTALKQFYSMS